MPPKEEMICHQGIVESCDKDMIVVKILAKSACSSCQARGACNLSDVEEKFVEATNRSRKSYPAGAQVTVAMRESLGSRAVLLAYLAPFVIVAISVFILKYLTGSELQAGLVSLLMLIPYYLLLYLFRHRFKKVFSFEIRD